MAEKVKLDIDAIINTADSEQKLRNLKRALREVEAGGKDFDKVSAAIRDTGDAIDSAKLKADDLKGSLEGAPGPVGQLFRGLKQVELATKSWGFALKATGIGLIVSLVGMLVAAFAKTEDSMKKMEPLFIAFEQLFQGIVAALEPAIEQFTQLALDVMPLVTNAFKYVYSAVGALLQSIGKLGSAIGKLFKGDFKGAWQDAKESVTGFTDNFSANVEKFEAGTKKMTKTQKENLKEQQDARQKWLDDQLKKLEAQDKLDAARLEKLKAEALAQITDEEEQAEEKLAIEAFYYEESYKLQEQDLKDKQALYSKGSLEWKGYQAELTQLEADAITKRAEFRDAAQKIADEKEKKRIEEERELAFQRLENQITDLEKQNELLDYDFAEDQARLEEKRLLLDAEKTLLLENTELTEAERLKIIADYAQKERDIDLEITESKKAEFESRIALQMQYADYVQQFGQLIGQIAGKSKGLAIAGIIIEQGAALAKVIMQTQAANAAITAAAGVQSLLNPFMAPIIAANATRSILMNNIQAGLSIAGIVAGAAKGIQDINRANVPGGGGGGGASSGGGAAPKFAGAGGMSAPQVQTSVGETTGTQIASTINKSQQPVRAYVVSQDISSNQALDRRTNAAATFGG